MANEKQCPFSQKECIRDDCKLWLKVTLTGKDKEGKAVSQNPPEQCSFVWSGLLGLRQMQLGWDKPPAAPPKQQ